jgi:hypothetical protein
MNQIDVLSAQIRRAKAANDFASVQVLEQELNRVYSEESSWLPDAINRANDAGDTASAGLLQQQLDSFNLSPSPTTPNTFAPSTLTPAPTTAPAPVETINEDAGILENLLAGTAAGVVNLAETSALGLATLREEEAELRSREFIQGVGDALTPDAGNPDDFSYKLGTGIGSVAGAIGVTLGTIYGAGALGASAVAAGLSGVAAGALTTAFAGAGEASERARAFGASEDERNTAALKGFGVGTAEQVPILKMLRIPGVSEVFNKLDADTIGRVGSAVVAGTGEAAQEAISAILQNLIAKGYDPEQVAIDAGVYEEGQVGGATGFFVQLVTDQITGRRGKVRTGVSSEQPDNIQAETQVDSDDRQLDLGLDTPETLDSPPTEEQVNELLDREVLVDEKTGDPYVIDDDGNREYYIDQKELAKLVNTDRRLTDAEERKVLKYAGWKRKVLDSPPTEEQVNELLDREVLVDEKTGDSYVIDNDGNRKYIDEKTGDFYVIDNDGNRKYIDQKADNSITFETETEMALGLSPELKAFLDKMRDRKTDAEVKAEAEADLGFIEDLSQEEQAALFEDMTFEEQEAFAARNVRKQEAAEAEARTLAEAREEGQITPREDDFIDQIDASETAEIQELVDDDAYAEIQAEEDIKAQERTRTADQRQELEQESELESITGRVEGRTLSDTARRREAILQEVIEQNPTTNYNSLGKAFQSALEAEGVTDSIITETEAGAIQKAVNFQLADRDTEAGRLAAEQAEDEKLTAADSDVAEMEALIPEKGAKRGLTTAVDTERGRDSVQDSPAVVAGRETPEGARDTAPTDVAGLDSPVESTSPARTGKGTKRGALTTTPAVETTTPAVETTTPAVETTTPAVETTTPAVKPKAKPKAKPKTDMQKKLEAVGFVPSSEDTTVAPTINPETGKFRFTGRTRFTVKPHAASGRDTSRANGLKNTPRKDKAPDGYDAGQKEAYNANTVVHKYLNQFDDLDSALDSAIYDVADPKSVVYKKPNKKSGEVDPLAPNLESTGGENGQKVLDWATNNLSAETMRQVRARMVDTKARLKLAEEGIIKKGEAAAADAAMLAEREADARTQESLQEVGSAQEIADAEADAAEAQETLDTEGRVETTRAKTADKSARKKKEVSKRKSAQESADANFAKVINNNSLDYTSTNNKGLLTTTAKRNVERAESYANASSDPETNLKQLAEVLAVKRAEAKKAKAEARNKAKKDRQDAKKVSEAEANLDARKDVKPKPKTTKQEIIDAAVEKFTKVKGITREDVIAAYNLAMHDVPRSKRDAESKKFFADASPDLIKESARIYKIQKEFGYDFLELDVDVAATMDTDLSKDVIELLSKGDLPGAMQALVSGTKNNRVKQVIKALSNVVDGVKVEVVNTGDLESIGYTPRTDDNVIAGVYDANSNTIFINSDNPLTVHTLLHEITHAATVATLNNPSDPNTKKIQKLYNDLVASGNISQFDNITNIREFVAEAFSNPAFQLRLAELNSQGKDYTALQAFFDAVTNIVRRAYGAVKRAGSKVSGIGGDVDVEFSGSALTAVDQTILTMLSTDSNFRGMDKLAAMETQSAVRDFTGEDKWRPATSPLAKAIFRGLERKSSSSSQRLATLREFFFKGVDMAKQPTQLALGALDLQTLGDVARNTGFGQLGYDLYRAISAQRVQIGLGQKSVESVLVKFRDWANSVDSKVVDSFNTLIYSTKFGATIYGVDPELSKVDARTRYEGKEAGDGRDLFDVWLDQREHWDNIGERGQAEFRRQRKLYKGQFDDLLDVVFGQIDSTSGDNKELAAKMKDRIARELAGKGALDVYFPLVREGKYKVAYSVKVDGKEQPVFLMFQTKGEQEAAALNAAKDAIGGVEGVRTYDADMDIKQFNKTAPSGSLVADILQLLRANDISPDIQTSVMNMFINTLPETAFAKSLQGRNNVYGFEPNAALGLEKKGYSLAAQIAKIRSAAKISALKEKIIETAGDPKSIDPKWKSTALRNYTRNELLDRADFALSGSPNNMFERGAKIANQIAFIYTIGFNASSALVNLAQLPSMVFPNLASVYGIDATVGALNSATARVMARGNRIDRDYDVKQVKVTRNGKVAIELQVTLKESKRKQLISSAKNPLSLDDTAQVKRDIEALERDIPLIKHALEQGLIETTVGMDISAAVEASGEKRTKKWTSLDWWGETSAIMFNSAERFNRQSSLLASYDLLLQQMDSSKRVYSKLQAKFVDVPSNTEAKRKFAAEEAAYVTHELNGGATLETTPRLIRANLGRIAGMYKSFGMRMYTTMIKSHYDLVVGGTKDMPRQERNEIRTQALKAIVGVNLTAFAVAGVQGMPLFGIVQFVRDLFKEDDEDMTRAELQHALTAVFDDIHLGLMAYKGPLSYYSGVDVSQRVALTNLLFQENRYNPEPTEEELVAMFTGGPAWSTVKRIIRGVEDVKKENYQRAIENFLPAGVNNLYRITPVGRFYQERGMYTKTTQGRSRAAIYEGLTNKDLLLSGVGFPPMGYAVQQEVNARVSKKARAIGKQRKDLMSEYITSYMIDDSQRLDKIMPKIIAFNDKNPTVVINEESLYEAILRDYATTASMQRANGLYVNPKLINLVDEAALDAVYPR